MNEEMKNAIVKVAGEHSWDPQDIATVISYETGGTFDPWKKGPTTQWGEHRGLIQWGEPQRKQYGIYEGMPVADQVEAVGRYLVDRGVKSGDGILPIYAAINGGNSKAVNASDENNGGAPGTVYDKVTQQMDGHRRNAAALLGGTYKPITVSASAPGQADFNSYETSGSPAPKVGIEDNSPGFWQTVQDTIEESDTAWWLRKNGLTGPEGTPDPSFTLTPERLTEDLKARGLDGASYDKLFDTAFSEERYQTLLAQAEASKERQGRLAQAGLTGTALSVVTEIAEDLPADLALGTVAPYMVLGNRLGRVGRALYTGLTAAAVGGGNEYLATKVNPHKDNTDVLYSTVGGLVLGGLVGSLMKNPHTEAEAFHLQRTAKQWASSQNPTPVDPGVATTGSVGAARVRPDYSFFNDEAAELIEDADVAKAFGGIARKADLGGQLGTSPNPITRLFSGIVQDGVGKVGHAINPIAVTEDMSRFFEGYTTSYAKTYKPALAAYFKDNGVGFRGRAAAETEFNEQVAKMIRDRGVDVASRYHPEVVKMGRKISALQDDIRKLLNNPKMREGLDARSVAGFETLESNPHYLMRVWDHAKVSDAFTTYGKEGIDELLRGAIRSANPDMDEKLIARIAKGFSKSIINRAHGVDDMALRVMGGDNLEAMEQFLRQSTDVSDADIDDVLGFMRSKMERASDAGASPRGKHRVLLDEKFRLPQIFNPKHGVMDENGLGIEDLIVNDASYLFHRYARQTSGLAALGRFQIKDPNSDALIIDGITKDSDFDKVLDLVKKRAAEDVKEGKMASQKALDTDLKNLQFAYDYVRGRPVGQLSENWEDFLRLARKFNYTRLMGQVGFAQIPEFGRMIAHLGVKAAFSQTPALRRVLNESGESIRRSGLAQDVENVLMYGTERFRATHAYRTDDLSGSPTSLDRGRFRDRLEKNLDDVSHFTSDISGMNAANTVLQTWTASALIQKWANFAHTGKGLSGKRLADLGLAPEMVERIKSQFTKEGNFEYAKGALTKKKVLRANFDKWDDLEAREAFISAAYRQARYIIQANDIGNLHRIMSSTMAKTIMQFRTFMMGSWVKGTLKLAHFRDTPATASVFLGAALSGLSYVIQTKLKALTRGDRDEYEERMLSMKNIGAASFARIGESSILPMLADTAAPFIGMDPLFSATRTSGQTSSLLFGNPSADLLDTASQGLGGAVSSVKDGRSISQQEARSLFSLLPLSNTIPATTLFNGLIHDLPAYAPRKQN